MRKFVGFWVVLLVLAGLAIAGQAGAGTIATITFDTLPTGLFASYTEDEYAITWLSDPNLNYSLAVQNVGGANQNVLIDNTPPPNYWGVGIRVSRIDGNPFSLLSIDVADLNASVLPSTPGADPCNGLSILIWNPGGNCVVGFGPTSSTFATVSPVGLADILHVDFHFISLHGQIDAIDNIVLEAIPEPSTALLLGIGLSALAATRRRSQS